jgi:hypothetical protein
MSENYKKISRAITSLAAETLNSTSPLDITAELAAKKAKVSRATLYRYIGKHPELQASYDSLKLPTHSVSPGHKLKFANSDDALEEIDKLKKEVIAVKKERDEISETKNSQIILLWNECKRLRQLFESSRDDVGNNVFPIEKKPK